MRKMNLILLTIGVVVVLGAATGWLLCGGWQSFGARHEDDSSSPAAIDEIRVTGKAVAVAVRPGPAAGVTIHRTARYLNPLHERPGETHRIVGSVLELGGDDGPFAVIEYTVTAPAGVRVTADFETGSLDLNGVSVVDARVRTGSLKIADATGDIQARAETGSIEATGLRSDDVVAITGTGSVVVDVAIPADVEARSGTGSVDVTVPPDAYQVDASTGLGELRLGVANDPNASHRLALRSNMGRVTLATR
jgi:hypothetical protein